jgi:ATP-dependent protease ClpP protease subunit
MNYDVTFQDGGNTAVLDIDGFIGRDIMQEWMTGEKSKNTVENLKDELRGFSAKKIIVNIHSPGGNLSEGLVIKDMLQAKSAEVVTNLQGLSASAATAIHQAGDQRRMAGNTSFMLIHRSMLGIMGYFNLNSFEAFIEDARTIDGKLIQMYANRSNASAGEIENLMDEGEGYGKWIDADRALEIGLIDEIYDPGDEEDEDVDRLDGEERKNFFSNSSISEKEVRELIAQTRERERKNPQESVAVQPARNRKREVEVIKLKGKHKINEQ